MSGLNADTTADHGHYRRLVDGGTAPVLVNGPVEDLDVHCVCADDVAAAELGVRHLADLGHRRIGFASGSRRYAPSQRKLAGYLRGVEGLGLGRDEELIAETVYSVEGGQLAMARLGGVRLPSRAHRSGLERPLPGAGDLGLMVAPPLGGPVE